MAFSMRSRIDPGHVRRGPHFDLVGRTPHRGQAQRPVGGAVRSERREAVRLQWPTLVDRAYQLAAPSLHAALHRIALVRRLKPMVRVGVLSAARGEGRTTAALLLAHAARVQGEFSLVIDADFDNPSLARTLGVRLDDGCDRGVLAAGVEQARPHWKPLIVDRPSRTALLVPTLAACRRAQRGAAIAELNQLLNDLGGTFSLAILDTMPMDVATIASATVFRPDAVVLVYRSAELASDLLEKWRRLVGQSVPVIAVIENFARPAARTTEVVHAGVA